VILSDVTNETISPLILLNVKTPIALVGASKIFELSKSKIYRLKEDAIKAKFLEAFNTFEKLDIPYHELSFAKSINEIDYALRFGKNLYRRDIDLIKTKFRIYKKRKWGKRKKSKQ
jgi:hypothetical protein